MPPLEQAIRLCTSQDDLRLAYATMGKGPALVRPAHFLTHVEFDADSPVWRPWLAQLSRDRMLVRYDALGCGLSDGTSAPLSLPAFRQVFTSLFIPDGTPEQVRWFNELERLSCSPAHAAHTVAAFGRIDVSELAARVGCPTLVLHARGDARVPFEEGRKIAGLIPGARFVPLESRNHVLLEDEPAFAHCFGEIHAFLDAHDPAPHSTPAFPALTPRERELVELLTHGLDNLQIAAHLGVTEKTVRNKVSAVFDKLDVGTRAQAIVQAREAGFGKTQLPR